MLLVSLVRHQRNPAEMFRLVIPLRLLGAIYKLYSLNRCVLKELESLGKALYGAKLIAQRFQVRNCSHLKNPVSGSACLLSMIEEGNPHHFFVATQVNAHRRCNSISFESDALIPKDKESCRNLDYEILNSLWKQIFKSYLPLMYLQIMKWGIFWFY